MQSNFNYVNGLRFLVKRDGFELFSKWQSRYLLIALVLTLSLLTIQKTYAASTTWLPSPATNNWNTAGNWSAGVPNDVAEFNTSTITSLALSANSTLNEIRFNLAADAFTINPNGRVLTLNGVGVTNNSSNTQTFNITSGTLRFNNASTAGISTINNKIGRAS